MLTEFNDSIRIFRTDLLTSKSCGNKQFKLTNNLLELKRGGATRVLSFGGLWSNHLHAFAIACKAQKLESVAIVRGERLHTSALLNDAIDYGLKVHFVSRSEYRQRHNDSYIRARMRDLDCDAWLPEGGSNEIAVKSCEEIASLINRTTKPPANIALAVVTGATMAGIVNGAVAGQKVIGVPVVQDSRLRSSVMGWIKQGSVADWCLLDPAAPQQYGKVDQPLLEFVLETFCDTGVILDPVYNAKALRSLLNNEQVMLSLDDTCVFVHTGGLGGCLGFADKLLEIDSDIGSQLLAEVFRILDVAGSPY